VGAVTLVDLMAQRYGQRPMAASTAGDILERYGLVRKRTRRSRSKVAPSEPRVPIPGSGHTLTGDFKGQFRVGGGRYCYPLTLAEPISRYVFAVEALSSTRMDQAKKVFERVFHEWGVPEQIITDNGVPFCSPRSLGGLSELSKWWITCGARPVRIEPGKPQQNSRHERMHRTLKDETASPPASSMRAQQNRFNVFREEFNHVRPHQALGGKTPASRVRPFPGTMPRRFVDFEYPIDAHVRRVRSNGEIKWASGKIFLSEVLIGELIALVELDHGLFAIYFGPVRIGTLDASRNLVY
jgi:putative transposase